MALGGIAGKVALVTGVAAADELEEVVGEIRALGRRALALRADVSAWDEVPAAVAEAHDMV